MIPKIGDGGTPLIKLVIASDSASRIQYNAPMLRRFGYRRILPIVQIILFIALVTIGAIQVGHSFGPRVRQTAYQQDGELPEGHPQATFTMPFAWTLAIAINVPATMLGALCAEIFHLGSNLGALLCSMPFVLLLWYLVGHWLDHQLDVLPRRRPGNAIRIACWIGIILSAVLLAVGLMAFKSHASLNADVVALALGWLLWSLALLVMCLLTLQRRTATDAPAVLAP